MRNHITSSQAGAAANPGGPARARRERVTSHHRLLLALITGALALLAFAPLAEARTTRAYESSFGSFSGPGNLTVDQANGDVYVVASASVSSTTVRRFDSAGAPKNFTAGPDAGTNALTGFSSAGDVAVDSSGGPLDGTVYVTDGDQVAAFSRSGASLGSLDGSGTPDGALNGACGVAVDQSDGSLYVNASVGSGSAIWRYEPASPAGGIDDADYSVSGLRGTGRTCQVAAHAGSFYMVVSNDLGDADRMFRFAADDFTADPSSSGFPHPAGSLFASGVSAIDVDPGTGEVYVKHRDRTPVSVYDLAGSLLYEFGAAAYYGGESEGIAVRGDPPGPASKVYVASNNSDHEVDAFGPLTQAPTYTRNEIARFGPDGSAATRFGDPGQLALDHAARSLYAFDTSVPGLYGFDASAPPAFPPLAGFSPLGTAAAFFRYGIAVDNTALASAGNIYFASSQTDLLYGFDDTGAPLGGAFPLDPEIAPGAPDGSPKNLCGVAVDSAGNVWVANSATERILRYDSTGAYQSAIDTSAQGAPCNLALDSNDDLYAVIDDNHVWKYSAASGYSSAAHVTGDRRVIAVDPDADHLFAVGRGNPCSPGSCALTWIDEFDPAGDLVDEFAITPGANFAGVAVDPANGHLYVADTGGAADVILAFGPGLILPEVATAPVAPLANTTATLNGTLGTQNVPLTDCRFQYVTETAFLAGGFTDLSSGGEEACDPAFGAIPLDFDQHPVSAEATGLTRNTGYRFRLVAENADGSAASADRAFITAGPPVVETAGAPERTATTAVLNGRVNPRNSAATFHFEYGTQGPCSANPCTQTAPVPAGSDNAIHLVAERIEGLDPDTAYHYRIVADNGNPDGPAFGAEMTVTTRASDEPAGQGDEFPGPPGSDRAWEQVNLPDTGGNSVTEAVAFSTDGSRAAYGVAGGTPISEIGSIANLLFAERVETAPHQGTWESRSIAPPREELVGNLWREPIVGTPDLSTVFATIDSLDVAEERPTAVWSMHPDAPAVEHYRAIPPVLSAIQNYSTFTAHGLSADGSLALAILEGGAPDPAQPAAGLQPNIYDVSSGAPRLISLLPGETVAPCGANLGGLPTDSPFKVPPHSTGWIAADGSHIFFPSKGAACGGASQLYMRDLAAGETKLISGPPLSGAVQSAAFVRGTPEAAFFWTKAVLDPADSGTGGDVYRYDIAAEGLECLTCVLPGLPAEVSLQAENAAAESIAVAPDGSRLYFTSPNRLLPGAETPGAYRLEVATGELAYLAPRIGVGALAGKGNALNPDGSVLIFRSADPALNPLGEGGHDNGGSAQYYRYDDRDRSLVCVSCPADGSAPSAEVGQQVGYSDAPEVGLTPLSDDGQTFAFVTPTRLVPADQNTAPAGEEPVSGADAYEWRDGRRLLLSDGLSQWVRNGEPKIAAVGAGGRDVFFHAAARYTPDALDANYRLYDARIGGGFEFPQPPPPCPLEVCQGTPQGRPDLPAPGTSDVLGPGNPRPEAQSCAAPANRAKRLGRAARRHALRAKAMRRAARRSSNARRTRLVRRRAHRLATQAKRQATLAKRLRARAKRCSQNNRRAGR